MNPTELVEAYSKGKLSLAEARAKIMGLTWYQQPDADPANDVWPSRIAEAWSATDSGEELQQAVTRFGVDEDDAAALYEAFAAAPHKVKLTIEQLESGERPEPASKSPKRLDLDPLISDLGPLFARADGAHTGGMIALLPSAADAQRIAFPGGEPADELHVTLCYFADASAMPRDEREAILDLVGETAEEFGPLNANAFGFGMLNPYVNPCLVLNIGGEAVDAFRQRIVDRVLYGREDEHLPWLAHMTLTYGAPPDVSMGAPELFGPLTFDRVRVAFAGDTVDLALAFGTGVEKGPVTTLVPEVGYENQPRGVGSILVTNGELEGGVPIPADLADRIARMLREPTAPWQRAAQPHCPGGKKTGGRFSNDEFAGCEDEEAGTSSGQDLNESATQPHSQGPGEGARPPLPGEGLGDWMKEHPAEYAAYKAKLLARVQDLVTNQGQETELLYSEEGTRGNYTAERLAQQESILDELQAKASGAPNDRQIVIMGGLPGSGKTSALKTYAREVGIEQGEYATVNPDDIKEVLVQRGMVPRYEGLAPLESAGWITHEESSTVAKRYFDRLIAEGKNIALDVTMGGLGSFRGEKGYLAKLERAGYKIKMLFVDVTRETSMERATKRHQKGMDKEFGGRVVPDREIMDAKSERGYNSRHRDNFESLKGSASEWYLFENNGATPTLEDSWDGRHQTEEPPLRSLRSLLDELDELTEEVA